MKITENEEGSDTNLVLDSDGNPLCDFYHRDGVMRSDLPDGIYVGLSDALYFHQDRVGSTDFKVLGSDTPENWYYSSKHNKKRKPEADDTEDRVFGRALHAVTLEGEEVFKSRFIEKPATYKDAKTGEDKKWNMNANVCKDWVKARNKEGLTVVDPDVYEDAMDMGRLIRNHPQLKDILDHGAGLNEVAILITVGGLKIRTKLDRLLIDIIFDLKGIGSHRASTASPVWLAEKGIVRDTHTVLTIIRNLGYYIQVYLYRMARLHFLPTMVENHSEKTPFIYGASPAQIRFLQRVAANKTCQFVLLFFKRVSHSRKSPSAPIITPIVSDVGDMIDQRGYEKFELACKQYEALVERFGFDVPWLRVNEAVALSDEVLADILGPSHTPKESYQHDTEASQWEDDEEDTPAET